MERPDFGPWSAKDVARLLALLEAQLGYYREIAAALPIPLAVVSKDRAVVWTNRAFRKRFGTRTEDLPARGFTEIPMRAWHDEDETETLLLVLEPLRRLPRRTVGAMPGGLPAIVWQADAATLEFRSVEGGVEACSGILHRTGSATGSFSKGASIPTTARRPWRCIAARFAREARPAPSTGSRGHGPNGMVPRDDSCIGPFVTGVITNITSRKTLERQLLSAGRFEALYSFAGRLAHDLNNPLMIVTGYAEELMQALQAERIRCARKPARFWGPRAASGDSLRS